MIKKADIFLGIFLVLLCLSSLFLLNVSDGKGSQVIVTVNGRLYGTYDLSKNQRVEIKQAPDSGTHSHSHYNVIEIRDGAVFMEEADCPNQVCVRQGRIRRVNQTIACLPNKAVVSISGPKGEMDAVSY